MAASGSGTNNPKSTLPAVTDLLESGHALGQIAAAARGLEIALDQQTKRERQLLEENSYLRDSGRRLAAELTDLMMKVGVLEEELAIARTRIDEVVREKTLQNEEHLRREREWSDSQDRISEFKIAETIARDNQIREETLQLAKVAAAEAALEHEKLQAKLNEITAEFSIYRDNATTELARVRRENARLTQALTAIESEKDSARAQLIEVAEAARTRAVALENELSEISTAHREAQLQVSDLSARLDRERATARATAAELASIREETITRVREMRITHERNAAQAKTELEARLKQAEFDAKSEIDLARRENRDRIAELERNLQILSDELESERKLKHEAERVRHEAEDAREATSRDAAARVRRLEIECADLTDELKRTVETSERRIAEIRNEAKNEKIRLARESADAVSEARAREDEARALAKEAAEAAEHSRREAELAKRHAARMRAPAEQGLESLRQVADQLRAERDQLLRARAEERAEFQTELSRLRAEMETNAKQAREIQNRRIAAEVEKIRFETEAIAESGSTPSENPLAEVLRRKEREIERAKSRLAKDKTSETDH
ncbi:MAG: hypothetical protein JST04_15020 [Bdellovibrionales bacterium]|nr:hypothetical protein [Bdellovibrionales bacterium]